MGDDGDSGGIARIHVGMGSMQDAAPRAIHSARFTQGWTGDARPAYQLFEMEWDGFAIFHRAYVAASSSLTATIPKRLFYCCAGPLNQHADRGDAPKLEGFRTSVSGLCFNQADDIPESDSGTTFHFRGVPIETTLH